MADMAQLRNFARTVLLAIAGAGLLLQGACSTPSQRAKTSPTVEIGPEAFAKTAGQVELDQDSQAIQPDRAPVQTATEVVVRTATPVPAPRPEPVAPEGLALIEAKVGDINGKPIYVTSFFEPIEARLLAEAQRLRLAGWRNEALKIIDERLTGVMMDELLRAEALAALSVQQRQGLRAFLNNFRKDILTENLGSAQLAAKRGQSVDAAMREKEIETLVGISLFQEVNKRVHVSWRDIQQRYEQRYEDFNPPPTAVFRLLRVPTEETDSVEAIRSQIANGDPFETIASESWNTFQAADGGLFRAAFEGAFEEGEFFGSDLLNEQARGLSPGEMSEPFELSRFTCWLKLEAVERESVSLYDAQLAINVQLNQERREQARNEYFQQLFERARVGNREELLRRLMTIAEERYGPE
jgi:hypothetical protein